MQKNRKKVLTFCNTDSILIKSVAVATDEYGILAQLGEHLPYKQRVTGSSPVGPIYAGVAELADAQDLKSCGTYTPVSVRFRLPAYLNNLWA